ncbi:sigma-54-dependent Fis family transcriptional regulator, partial [bacterium]|nr:sigma-54-dependent Fis family transcriptional regulator [bacterium]
ADDRAGDVRLLGKSLAVQKLRKLLDRVAPGNHTVLIEGESGTGKELVARWLHARSERARGPFVAENLGALSEGVLEAELFGHAKGAFTGADRARPGLFQVADRGTLFLDEVAEIGPELQKKLLRVLQEREVRPVGGTSTVRVDIRVLAATNRNLDEMVRAGTFREDLFYRLGVIRVRVPTLRERKEDVPLLFEHFVARAASEQRRPIPETTRELERRLLAHAWPGNVRELEALATRFLLEGPGAELGSARAAPAGGGEAFRLEVELGKGPVLPLREVRQRLDKAYLALVLQRCDGKVSVAAKALEMDRTYISDLVKRFQLREGSPPPA